MNNETMQKPKKRSKKKIIGALLGVTAAATAGALIFSSLAFLVRQDEVMNRISATNGLHIALIEEKYNQLPDEERTNLIPNRTIDKDPKVMNTDQADAFVFLKVTVPVANITEKVVKNFSYTGTSEEYTIPAEGYYKLETWGASGGSVVKAGQPDYNGGGLGGYSCGYLHLNKDDKLYVAVGGAGESNSGINGGAGGFNGGAAGGKGADDARANQTGGSGGGGATHIASAMVGTGLLSEYVNNKDKVLLVAGGGGGCCKAVFETYPGGFGGGTVGGSAYAQKGTEIRTCLETDGGHDDYFGQRQHPINDKYYLADASEGNGGGGGGYYGGYAYVGNDAGSNCGGAGGSGYCSDALEGSETYPSRTLGGDQEFLSPEGMQESGHLGNGHARLTLVSSQAKQEIFYMKKTGTEKAEYANVLNTAAVNADDHEYWVELPDFEEGTDLSGETVTYVFGYSIYLRTGETSETLFDYIQLKNILQYELDPTGTLHINVEALGIQADHLKFTDGGVTTEIHKDEGGDKKIMTYEELKQIYRLLIG